MLLIDTSLLRDRYPKNTCDLLDLFISRLKAKTTQQNYLSALNKFHDFTKADLLHCDDDSVITYIDALYKSDGSRSSHIKSHKIIAAFFNWLETNIDAVSGIPEDYENPMGAAYAPNLPEEKIDLRRIPDLAIMSKLMSYLKNNDDTLYLAVSFAFLDYLKTSDMTDIKTGDFFQDDKTDNYYLSIGKRIIPIDDNLASSVESYISVHNNGLFLFGTDTPKKKAAWARLQQLHLKKAYGKLGYPEDVHYSLNAIRNFAITTAFASGATQSEISSALGQKTDTHIKRLSSFKAELPDLTGFPNISFK